MKTSKRAIATKALSSLFFIFMIFSMTLLSSCVATVRTPHHHRHSNSTIIISEGGKHDNGNHYGQKKNKQKH